VLLWELAEEGNKVMMIASVESNLFTFILIL
jgi:hypothetical protein